MKFFYISLFNIKCDKRYSRASDQFTSVYYSNVKICIFICMILPMILFTPMK